MPPNTTKKQLNTYIRNKDKKQERPHQGCDSNSERERLRSPSGQYNGYN